MSRTASKMATSRRVGMWPPTIRGEILRSTLRMTLGGRLEPLHIAEVVGRPGVLLVLGVLTTGVGDGGIRAMAGHDDCVVGQGEQVLDDGADDDAQVAG